MEFDLTEKQVKIRDRAREFALKQIKPRLAELAAGSMPPTELLRQLAELKLLNALVPEAEGGAELDQVGYALTLMEVARVWGSLAAVLLAHNSLYCAPLLAYASPEQREQYLKPCVTQVKLGCLAVSETESGLDCSRFKTRAVRRDKGWLINGNKGPVPNALGASYALTAAQSADPSGTLEVRLFVIPLDQSKGVVLGNPEQALGFSGAGLAEIRFENAPLTDDALLKGPGQGRQPLQEIEQEAWTAVAALATGIGQAILQEARGFAATHTQSGKPLTASQAVQWKLADLATDLEAAELLTLRAVWLRDQLKPFEKEAAMARQYALNMVMRAGQEGIRILYGHGYDPRSSMAQYVQDARGCQLFVVYDEALTSIIAKNLY